MSGDILEAGRALREAEDAAPVAVPSLERRRLQAYLALLVADIACIALAFVAAGWLYEGLYPHPTSWLQAQLLLPVYLTIALYNATYSLGALESLRFAIRRAGISLLVSAALLTFILFYAKSNAVFSRVASTLALVLAFALIVVTRSLAHAVIARRWQGRVANVLAIAAGGPEIALPNARRLDAAGAGIDPSFDDPHTLDRLGGYLHNQDKVVVSCPLEERERWALVLKAAGVTGEVVSETAHSMGAIGVSRYDALGRSALIVAMGPLGLRARALKRVFDLAVALVGSVVLAPLMALLALAIKLGDGGPVLFVQPRVGRGNRLFPVYKFRTMNAWQGDQAGERSTSRSDPRVTRIGNWLRRTSLDELPQLWNVLRGDMSVVGPRPHALASLAGEKLFWEVDARYWHRHALKPGMTGLAQVRGLRGSTEREVDLAVRLQADLEYIADWNLLRDVGILLRTLFVMVHRRAY